MACFSDESKEGKLGGACRTYEGEEKYIYVLLVKQLKVRKTICKF